MKLVVMGTGPFAVPMFESLLASKHQLLALVTRPVRPSRQRGRSLAEPMRQAGLAAGLEILDPEDVNTSASQQQLAELAADLLVVCDFGQILSADSLSVTPLGGINLHGSLLPRYRGAAPVQWALIQGESATGVSVIHMTPRLDAGPILASRKTTIGPCENAGELEQRLSILGVEPVLDAIDLLTDWDQHSSLGIQQQEDQACPARRLTKQDGQLDWSLPAVELCRRLRGLQPWPGCFTNWQRVGKPPLRLIIEQAEPLPAAAGDLPAAGTVTECDGTLLVATGDGLLSLLQVQPAGKRSMSIEEFSRGYQIAAGDQLGP